ncbi:beta-ketoacyl synthase N-terminal-like domain-containing protein [Allonocardiopsis opalescens]|uniref:3-oxoacyl-[acyl-carrier-protein] synthase II n=1 Tax=Allonocardiopsis opalescens TaxID=1144618 RepID=A0A2T0PUI9_9ACTN|nr:beta-ketoacyl synthase N-terminal-like domain-containing protein [Allonocardiopsis opalescens]PRX92572.1 3-oxoacyl-[acyl-carrier-protein] synthase II [Allonocardiopsis opalescens]
MSAAIADIVACGVLSAAGSGLPPLAAALAGPPDREEAPDREAGDGGYPPLRVRPVADARIAERLGRKGLARLTRTDQLGMAATAQAIEQLGGVPADAADRTGVVLGTSVGSTGRIAEFTRDTFVRERPYMVNPSHFPGTLMNSCAGQTAIRYGLTGVNSTLSGGATAGLAAVRFACNALANGHADLLLTGGVEELSAESAWAWHRTGLLGRDVAVGEGGAVFALARGTGGRAPLARLLACELGFADPAQGPAAVARGLAGQVERALARAGLTPAEVTVAVPGAGGPAGWGAVEERALRSALGLPGPRRLRPHRVIGETHGASAALGLAALLAHWSTAEEPGGTGLVTALSPDGQVGCLLVGRAEQQ